MSIIDQAARRPTAGYQGHFGGGNTDQRPSGGQSRRDLPQATIWLNVGYTLEGAGKDGEDLFISLPVGLPIDTMQSVSESSNNADYANMQQARNALLAQLIEASNSFEPGEERLLPGLQLQMRRVKNKEVGDVAANPLVKPIDLF